MLEDPRKRYEADLESITKTLTDQGEPPDLQEDMLVAAAHLGLRRARLLDTRPGYDEIVFALSIFTWWPFKPRPADDVEAQLAPMRDMITGLASTMDFNLFSMLDALVPDETLLLSTDELHARQQESVLGFLTASPEESGPALAT